MPALFVTDKKESFKSRMFRRLFHLLPAYHRSGGKVVFISGDWLEVHVRVSYRWSTTNSFGAVFGGSIYAAIDPIYMMQFIHILGKDYVVWDKAADIKFIRPIRKAACARFLLNNDIIDEVRQNVAKEGKYVITLPVEYVDKNGTVYAVINKSVYIADKRYYQSKTNNQA